MTALVQAVHVMAASMTAGALIFAFIALPAPHVQEIAGAARDLGRLATWSLAAAVATAALWLWLVAAGMSAMKAFDPALAGEAVRVLAGTSFGRLWLWRLAAAAVVALLLAVGRGCSVRWPAFPAAVVAIVYLGSLAGMAHAAAALDSRVEVPILALHITCAGVWFGVVVALRVMLRGAGSGDGRALAAATRRAGDISALMVALLAIGGSLSATFRMLQPAAVTNQYGMLLVAKFLFFTAALAVAAVNRGQVLPRLIMEGARQYDAQRALARNVTIEIILLAAALSAAGWLATTAPSVG